MRQFGAIGRRVLPRMLSLGMLRLLESGSLEQEGVFRRVLFVGKVQIILFLRGPRRCIVLIGDDEPLQL